jgi:hypothetical protein
MGKRSVASSSGDVIAASARPRAVPQALSNVVYRSRAVAPLERQDLLHLVQTAQSRNQRESVTGVMLYDENCFFQWLEGPPDSVERVMHSIGNDPRHTDLEVLSRRAPSTRSFQGWDMKLAARGSQTLACLDAVIEPPAEIIARLHRQPDATPSLLVKLVPLAVEDASLPGAVHAMSSAKASLGQASASVLKAVILKSVLPSLLGRHSLSAGDEATASLHPRAVELAELLIATDQTASLDLIREIRGNYSDARHLYAPLFEPAARSLGNLWMEDSCSEFDVTLALCRLQTAVRLLGADAPRTIRQTAGPQVLITPVPGEMHQLVASLDSEWLWKAGWAPQIEFPADDRALGEMLSASWIDVLDLSLSAAFRREASLSGLATTVAQARRASQNPSLVIVVGGRAFVEDNQAGLDTGADLVSGTSKNIDRRILQQMRSGAFLEVQGGPGARPVGDRHRATGRSA